MGFRKVTAIIRHEMVEKVEQKLKTLGVHGVSITKVKGYGEYADFYTHDMMVTHAKIEIFTMQEKADAIAAGIMEAAHVGQPGDGIVAILPVEKIYRIHTRAEATSENV